MIRSLLGKRQFETTKKTDVDDQEIEEAIKQLNRKMNDHKSGVRLFYFSGHGGRDFVRGSNRASQTVELGADRTIKQGGYYIVNKNKDKRIYCNDIIHWLKVGRYYNLIMNGLIQFTFTN